MSEAGLSRHLALKLVSYVSSRNVESVFALAHDAALPKWTVTGLPSGSLL